MKVSPTKGVAALVLAVAIPLTACSTATEADETPRSSDDTCPDRAASDALEQDSAEAPADFLDLPKLTSSNPLEGMSLTYIASGLSLAFSQDVLAGVKAAADAAGATIAVSDSGGDPTKAGALIDQAISRGTDVILLQGTNPAAVSAGIKAADARGIPVVSVASLTPGPLPDETLQSGLSTGVGAQNDIGTRQANFVAADSGCDAHVAYVTVSTFPVSISAAEQFESRLMEVCPDCTVDMLDSPVTQWSNQLGPQINAFLLKNPDVDYVVTAVDDMFTAVKPAVQSLSGRDIALVGNNALQATVETLANNGGDPIDATIGTALDWMGWAAVDQAQRAIEGSADPSVVPVPNRTFTRENSSALDLANPASWYSSFDYSAEYLDLWQTR